MNNEMIVHKVQKHMSLVFWFPFIAAIIGLSSAAGTGLNQRLLVVSFDAFRSLYLEGDDISRHLITLNQFRSSGVFANVTTSIFPSDTFPNHFSIVTGMWAETHGIVTNRFYDPILNDTFTVARLDQKFWNAVEPIWVTAKKQGKKTSVNYWPGSYVKYPPNDYVPDYYRPVYDVSVPFEDRIDETVDHLANKGVDLAFYYFEQPDVLGHKYGIGNRLAEVQLYQNDWLMTYFLKKLDDAGLGKDKLNIIVLADHGMLNVTRSIQLADYTDMTANIETIPTYGPLTHIFPKEGKAETIYADLKRGEIDPVSGQRLFTVYRKSDIPENLHYTNNPRIPDIVVFSEPGIYMSITGKPSAVIGAHGYDPLYKEMRPLFMARGPAFKNDGYRAQQHFYTKDIYALITHIVGIEQPAGGTNASLDSVADMLTSVASSSLSYYKDCGAILYLFLISSIVYFESAK